MSFNIQGVLSLVALFGVWMLFIAFEKKIPRWSSDPWKQRRFEVINSISPLLLFLIFLTVRLWWDLTHPQQWERATNDPKVYGWSLAVAWLVYFGGIIFIVRHERRMERKEKVSLLLKRTERLMREKRFPEAASCLDEAKRLSGYQPNHKENKNGAF